MTYGLLHKLALVHIFGVVIDRVPPTPHHPAASPPPPPTATASSPPAVLEPAPVPPVVSDGVTDAMRAAWQRVAQCEVGGNWSMVGPRYSGIGFSNQTWVAYGGTQYAPFAGQATEDQQILIGLKVTGGWVPDQNGCSPNGW